MTIYDCFIFFNELDLLEIRLNVLDPVVDRFVLVEATRTHQGDPKPLHYAANRERYRKFNDRIIHVVVDDYPPNPTGDPWVLERHQRRAIHRGLKAARPDDAIVVSDLDELPNPDRLRPAAATPGVKIFHQQLHYYFLDNVLEGDPFDWVGARSVLARHRHVRDVQELRELALTMFSPSLPGLRGPYDQIRRRYLSLRHRVSYVPDGGWQFSYLGGTDAIAAKLRAFTHKEYNTPEFTDQARLQELVSRGEDIFGRSLRFSTRPPPLPLPRHVLENRARYSHLFREPAQGRPARCTDRRQAPRRSPARPGLR
jgi:hypothetical protein